MLGSDFNIGELPLLRFERNPLSIDSISSFDGNLDTILQIDSNLDENYTTLMQLGDGTKLIQEIGNALRQRRRPQIQIGEELQLHNSFKRVLCVDDTSYNLLVFKLIVRAIDQRI